MSVFVRGAAVFFEVTFLDEDGAAVTPSAATMKIAYKVAGALTTITVAMTAGTGDAWEANWDSSPADSGLVWWWAQSGDPPKSATQGYFDLKANLANPQA